MDLSPLPDPDIHQPTALDMGKFLELFTRPDNENDARAAATLRSLSELLAQHPQVSSLWAAAWEEAARSQTSQHVDLFRDLTRDGLNNLGTWIHASNVHLAACLPKLHISPQQLAHIFSQVSIMATTSPFLPLVMNLRTLLFIKRFQRACLEICLRRESALRAKEGIHLPADIPPEISLRYRDLHRITPDDLSAYMRG